MVDLKSYFHDKYQGGENFIENVILPIFGKDKYEDAYEEDVLANNPELTTMAQNTGVAQILRLGTINIPMNPTDVFDITVNDHVQMKRNRVAVQQLIRRIMSTYSSAFMIFHYNDDDKWDWRFTFCSKQGNNNESTDSKRYTFLLGPNQSCRTAADNFKKLASKGGNIELKDIVNAFDVEALSDEFFDKYKEQYEKFVMFITGKKFVKKDGGWKEKVFHEPHPQMYADFGRDDKRVRDYVKKMLGRIVFLHYLQKKGWLGVEPGKEWNSGNKDFMYDLFINSSEGQQSNFLDEVLEPLFNDAFDTDRSANGDLYDTKVIGLPNNGVLRFPYLNGGLFGRDEDDEITTVFPADYFSSLFTMFHQYNFTIDENDPSDAEVGIDPEMLGQIFENLLEDNKDKGAYYTPKEIVRYMCKESLISYLQNDFPCQHREAIRQFVTTYDLSVLPVEIVEEVDRRLINIKICDPAIGSGAFPMGLLKELFFCRGAIENFDNSVEIKRHIIQENIYGVDLEKGAVDIARLRFWLTLVVDEASPEVLPNLDYKIMQGNSLFTTFNGKYLNISDSQQHKNIHKIRQKKAELSTLQKYFFEQTGDDKLRTGITIKKTILDIIALQLGYELEAWVKASATQGVLFAEMQNEVISMQQIKSAITGEKKAIIQLGEELRRMLTDESLPLEERAKTDLRFFDWKVMYSDVFEQGGFDIVIGNPPYGAKLSDDDKKVVKKFYKTTESKQMNRENDAVYLRFLGKENEVPCPKIKGSTDTYTLFIELAYWLLRKDAFMAYIIPISLTSSDSLSGVHKLLLEKCRGIKISSYSVRPQPVFKNAVVNTSILMFQKTLTPCQQLLSTKMHRRSNEFDLQTLVDNLQFIDVQENLKFGRIPKIGLQIEKDILNKLKTHETIASYIVEENGKLIVYRFAGGRYFKVVTNYYTGSSAERALMLDEKYADAIGCILSSNLSFWFYQIYSDNLNWKDCEITSVPVPNLSDKQIDDLNNLYSEYLQDIENNANVRQSSGNSTYHVSQFKEYKIVKSKSIIDRIDDYICPLYGLTDEERDFVKNYELEFRMSGDD
ncbi:MAG: Eco57I restriction-modification methylase domain-containing protein [Bacteroidales bacterium]|nr:Eco57I restriction-modification methylase domain-containing protein [Bacteroidales bacterium]